MGTLTLLHEPQTAANKIHGAGVGTPIVVLGLILSALGCGRSPAPPLEVPPGPYLSERMVLYSVDKMSRLIDTSPLTDEAALSQSADRTLSLWTTPSQMEAVSFVIAPRIGGLADVTLSISDLTDSEGEVIPSSAVDPYLVKGWYTVDCDDLFGCAGDDPSVYWPELLLRDDSIITADHNTQSNHLNFDDLPTIPEALQPFDVPGDENRQIWLKVRTPPETEPGVYIGEITVTNQSDSAVIPLAVEVLDIALLPSLDDNSVYTGIETALAHLGAENYERVVADMAEHGVNMPYVVSPVEWIDTAEDQEALFEVLEHFERAGMLQGRAVLSIGGLHGLFYEVGNNDEPIEPALESEIATKSAQLYSLLKDRFPETTFYLYGVDEGSGNPDAYRVARENGMPIFSASNNENQELAYRVRFSGMWWIFSEWAWQIHSAHIQGMRSGLYTMGAFVRDPTLYRLRGGFWLHNQPIDAYIPWVYADTHGRDGWTQENHWYFVRGATNGVVDTLHWEGFQAGAVDQQMISTLAQLYQAAYEAGVESEMMERAYSMLQYVELFDFMTIQETSAAGYNDLWSIMGEDQIQLARRDVADLIISLQIESGLHTEALREASDSALIARAREAQLARTPLLTKEYPYGVDEWVPLRESFFEYYNAGDFESALPYAETLDTLILELNQEFHDAPMPDWEGEFITPLEYYLLKMEVDTEIAEVLAAG